MKPPTAKWQGALDGLCGIYSIVNACALLPIGDRLTQAEYRRLFAALCSGLAERSPDQPLGKLLTAGLDFKTVKRLTDLASTILNRTRHVRLHRQVAFRRHPESLDNLWDVLIAHVSVHGPGSIILGTSG